MKGDADVLPFPGSMQAEADANRRTTWINGGARGLIPRPILRRNLSKRCGRLALGDHQRLHQGVHREPAREALLAENEAVAEAELWIEAFLVRKQYPRHAESDQWLTGFALSNPTL
jgi:hypothetical protein